MMYKVGILLGLIFENTDEFAEILNIGGVQQPLLSPLFGYTSAYDVSIHLLPKIFTSKFCHYTFLFL